jgi:hypothetical protein
MDFMIASGRCVEGLPENPLAAVSKRELVDNETARRKAHAARVNTHRNV